MLQVCHSCRMWARTTVHGWQHFPCATGIDSRVTHNNNYLTQAMILWRQKIDSSATRYDSGDIHQPLSHIINSSGTHESIFDLQELILWSQEWIWVRFIRLGSISCVTRIEYYVARVASYKTIIHATQKSMLGPELNFKPWKSMLHASSCATRINYSATAGTCCVTK